MFLNMGQSRHNLCLFSSFSHHISNTIELEPGAGLRTWGRRMVSCLLTTLCFYLDFVFSVFKRQQQSEKFLLIICIFRRVAGHNSLSKWSHQQNKEVNGTKHELLQSGFKSRHRQWSSSFLWSQMSKHFVIYHPLKLLKTGVSECLKTCSFVNGTKLELLQPWFRPFSCQMSKDIWMLNSS